MIVPRARAMVAQGGRARDNAYVGGIVGNVLTLSSASALELALGAPLLEVAVVEICEA